MLGLDSFVGRGNSAAVATAIFHPHSTIGSLTLWIQGFYNLIFRNWLEKRETVNLRLLHVHAGYGYKNGKHLNQIPQLVNIYIIL